MRCDFFLKIIQILNWINYSFNAVSTTLLKKGLKRILDIMAQPAFNRFYKSLPVDCIESIVQSALGDIRNAVINLHFAAQKGKLNLNKQ